MQLSKKFFPELLKDNEELYFANLYGVIDSVDELCILEITKTSDAYIFRIATSLPKYNEMLLSEIGRAHV